MADQSPTNAIADGLRPLTAEPSSAVVLCDIDGTLAEIAPTAEQAVVSQPTAELLRGIARLYRGVACVSGRPATAARELVGVEEIVYAGSHGAELLRPGRESPETIPELSQWREAVKSFADSNHSPELSHVGVRREDKDAIVAFHWRSAPDEAAAVNRLTALADAAQRAGLRPHWGRKVMEVRPPVDFDKGRCVARLICDWRPRAALYAGDDRTDLDAFDALGRLRATGALEAAVLVGVCSEEGPAEVVQRANLIVDGVYGFNQLLGALVDA